MKRKIGEQLRQPTCTICGITLRKWGDLGMPRCKIGIAVEHNFQ